MILLWKLTTVSIHAPTWGATLDLHVSSLLAAVVSIHAPTWGATSRVCSQARRNRFQSTRPRGARHVDGFSDKRVLVSIHAPTWGATFLKSAMMLNAQFQSTRPRGARLSLLCTASFRFSFNPRAHVGRDVSVDRQPAGARVSIHAPTWGATGTLLAVAISCSVSIHAPTWGATRPISIASSARRVSIHAPTWGATSLSALQGTTVNVSIHAPTWGATTSARCLRYSHVGFNPRAHVGRDTLLSQIVKFCQMFQSTRPRGARL